MGNGIGCIGIELMIGTVQILAWCIEIIMLLGVENKNGCGSGWLYGCYYNNTVSYNDFTLELGIDGGTIVKIQ